MWLGVLVFSDKYDKSLASSPTSSLYWFAGAVKELTKPMERVGFSRGA